MSSSNDTGCAFGGVSAICMACGYEVVEDEFINVYTQVKHSCEVYEQAKEIGVNSAKNRISAEDKVVLSIYPQFKKKRSWSTFDLYDFAWLLKNRNFNRNIIPIGVFSKKAMTFLLDIGVDFSLFSAAMASKMGGSRQDDEFIEKLQQLGGVASLSELFYCVLLFSSGTHSKWKELIGGAYAKRRITSIINLLFNAIIAYKERYPQKVLQVFDKFFDDSKFLFGYFVPENLIAENNINFETVDDVAKLGLFDATRDQKLRTSLMSQMPIEALLKRLLSGEIGVPISRFPFYRITDDECLKVFISDVVEDAELPNQVIDRAEKQLMTMVINEFETMVFNHPKIIQLESVRKRLSPSFVTDLLLSNVYPKQVQAPYEILGEKEWSRLCVANDFVWTDEVQRGFDTAISQGRICADSLVETACVNLDTTQYISTKEQIGHLIVRISNCTHWPRRVSECFLDEDVSFSDDEIIEMAEDNAENVVTLLPGKRLEGFAFDKLSELFLALAKSCKIKGLIENKFKYAEDWSHLNSRTLEILLVSIPDARRFVRWQDLPFKSIEKLRVSNRVYIDEYEMPQRIWYFIWYHRGTLLSVLLIVITIAPVGFWHWSIINNTNKAIEACKLNNWDVAAKVIQEADKTNPSIQFYLGELYANGYGFTKDEAMAVNWYRKAAEQGYAQAQNNLWKMYVNNSRIAKDDVEAVRWCRKAAELGNANAQFNLGARYANGLGVEKDESKALEWYRKAAELGNVQAQNNLGLMYAKGKGVAKDDVEAVKWYRKAAEQDYADAQNNLGVMYANGLGIEKNEVEAIRWYRKAAEQGYADAQNNIGVMYANGLGVEKDDEEAVRWYRKAAEQGNAHAQYSLGLMCENGRGVAKDDEEASGWYRKAAEQGYVRAQYNIGWMYGNGLGVKKDDAEAVKWYRKAAEQGYADAQYNLGVMYANGLGIEKNEVEAVKWYRKAAAQGDVRAQNNLGLMYANGFGVVKDEEEAVRWYRKAAEQGYADAQDNLGLMYANGCGIAKDDVEAVKWYRKAAEQGNAKAQYALGDCYVNGNGVSRNYEQAFLYFKVAAEQGNSDAQERLGWCYETGYGAEQDWEAAVRWYRKAAELGNAQAQNNLGLMYENCRGVRRDYVEAVRWYRKAAEQGFAQAQYNLWKMYVNNLGIAEDDVEAIKWCRKAAEQGNADAQNNLGVMYANGRGVAKDYGEAVELFRKAAEQGYADAQNNLGVMYVNGRGTVKDNVEAVRWFRKAAEQGYAQTQYNLGVMYDNGCGVAKDEVEAVRWYRKAAKQGLSQAQEELQKRGLSW